MNLNVTFDSDGYVHNFAVLGAIDGGEDVVVEDDLAEAELDDKLPFYRKMEGSDVLQFDVDRYQARMAAAQAQANNAKYIPDAQTSMRNFMCAFLKSSTSAMSLTDDVQLQISGIYDVWAPGSYAVGDIRNHDGQTWECFQAHDNATYPDIKPGTAAWFTFWRPLHGKSPETARPFVPGQPAHSLYRVDEYMVYNGKICRCKRDTTYNPDEDPDAWENVE